MQHPLNHFGHGEFLRCAVSDDGLLHFPWSHFEDLKARLGNSRKCRAARFSHHHGGLEILRVKNSFNDAHRWLVLLQHGAKGLNDPHEATRVLPCGRAGNRAVSERLRIRLRTSNHAITGTTQRGIKAKDDLMRIGIVAKTRLKDRRSRSRGPVQALFHPLELQGRDSHAQSVPMPAALQKEKREKRGCLSRSRFR